MEEALYNNIRTSIPDNQNCSANYKEEATSWLAEKSESYYSLKNANIVAGNEDSLLMVEEHIHRPENCKSEYQQLIVCHHLLRHYELEKYQEDQTNKTCPPCAFVLVEGLPGVGKTFVTKTLQNITRKVCNSNGAEMSSDPTGCAASLIDG